MKSTVTGRSVFVTGASGGIGTATCKELVNRGFRVYAGVRSYKVAITLSDVVPILVDVTDPESIADAADEVAKREDGQGLYALVNNAGIIVQGPTELVSYSALARQFETNVFGPVHMIQKFLPLLRQGEGRIVNISATSGRVAFPFLGPVSASKSALESFSDALRVELAPWRIPVTVVQPGAMQTEIFAKSGLDLRTTLEEADPRSVALYGRQLEAFEKALTNSKISPADVAAKVIVKAVEARKPKAYYTAGSDARQAVWLSRVPPLQRDRLFARVLGLSGIKAPR